MTNTKHHPVPAEQGFGAGEIHAHSKTNKDRARDERKSWANNPEARKAPPFYVGETYLPVDIERHGNGAAKGKRVKASRRLLRASLKRKYSHIEQSFIKARGVRLESERLATNSHEAQRYVAAERDERVTGKLWWRSFLATWGNIGAKFRSLLAFARAK